MIPTLTHQRLKCKMLMLQSIHTLPKPSQMQIYSQANKQRQGEGQGQGPARQASTRTKPPASTRTESAVRPGIRHWRNI